MGKKISKNTKKRIFNVLFLLILTGVTLVILFTSNRELNFHSIRGFLRASNPAILAAAFGCMLLFILFEGLSLYVICKKLGQKPRLLSAMAYSSADVYYSALTPSASGGQPASAYYMVKDGIKAGTATFALIFNLVAYTAAILLIGLAAIIARPRLFLSFGFWVKFLVIAGFAAQIILLGFFVACMFCHKAVLKAGNWGISLLAKIHILKTPEKADAWRKKLSDEVEKYREGYIELKKHRSLFAQALLLNVAQRFSQILITCFVCLAADKQADFVALAAMQSFVTVGYNSVPLPGGVGAFEYIYLNVYSLAYGDAFILAAVMVTRAISYYLCMAVSGAYTLIYHLILMKKNNKNIQKEKSENAINE